MFDFIFGITATTFSQNKNEDKSELKAVFDEYKVEGTFVLYDLKRKK